MTDTSNATATFLIDGETQYFSLNSIPASHCSSSELSKLVQMNTYSKAKKDTERLVRYHTNKPNPELPEI